MTLMTVMIVVSKTLVESTLPFLTDQLLIVFGLIRRYKHLTLILLVRSVVSCIPECSDYGWSKVLIPIYAIACG